MQHAASVMGDRGRVPRDAFRGRLARTAGMSIGEDGVMKSQSRRDFLTATAAWRSVPLSPGLHGRTWLVLRRRAPVREPSGTTGRPKSSLQHCRGERFRPSSSRSMSSRQIVGPYLEDRTTIAFAELMEREFGGFVPPPGYAG